jgi:simple sugar transport system permease protein
MQNTLSPTPQQVALVGATGRTWFTRTRIIGLIGLVVALLLILGVYRNLSGKLAEAQATNAATAPASIWSYVTTLNVPQTGGVIGQPLFRIPLPTMATVLLIQGVLGVLGAYLIVRQPLRWSTAYASAMIGLAFFTILLWAVAGSSVDIVDVLARVVRLATPLTLGALAGLICERSGVVNIGIEGTMLTAACLGYIAAILSGSTWIGVLAAMLTGALISALHALLSVTFKVDQTISGTVINLLAVGVTGYLRGGFIINYERINGSAITAGQLKTTPIPLLSQIPVIGPVIFNHAPITYAMLILVFVVNLLLFRTVWGLRTRAVGEQPKAADTVGIPVNRLRFRNVVVSGLISGLAGAWFSLESTFRFDDVMTNGRGFIALAAMIFGKWTPLGAFGGALLFSSADALQIKLQGFNFALPRQFLQMLPYIVTLIVLAGLIGRARPPAAVGKPYEKG